ncbi:MAG: hypothetical protein A2X22_06280 [Bacteroidetes bacterium GWF2_49_14]|nr:MAG: hypothetical protein A2X22_06280 [Bacteroidetes bacterium GWF2_49_14]
MNMTKPTTGFSRLLLIAMICMLGTGISTAQTLTTSPYSRFGIGDLLNRSTGQGQAMGGLTCGLRSNHNLNLLNPASLSALDVSEVRGSDFLFEVSTFERVTNLRTETLNRTVNNIGFSYLALGFPVTKWWKAGVGVLPYSNVGYSIATTETHPQMGDVTSSFKGTGGVSQFFLSSAISPVKYISLGATFSYLFGPINHSRSLTIPKDSMYFSTQSTETAILGDIGMSYGAQVMIPLPKNFFINLGGTFQATTNLNAESRLLVISAGTGFVDTLLYTEDPGNSVILPMGWAAGFTFGQKNKFTAGFDYRTQDWSKAEFLGRKDSLGNSRDFIFGFEYTPDYISLTRYMDRVRYRAGFRYSESYLQLNGTQLNEFGISFGAGFPILDRYRGGTQSSLNLILELGKRGTVKNELIREMFGNFTIQLTMHDYWFIKRKFD